jgi:excinuclease UvrABC ATPase subunit
MSTSTCLSGSGKSSLAFDTIYAEGQHRYVESLSAYASQFLKMMQKPDVDQIDGLSPAFQSVGAASGRGGRRRHASVATTARADTRSVKRLIQSAAVCIAERANGNAR